uniref:Ribonuclease H2 subunit C n=1 Tax=Plectus sambesii TaxID=2011161 RepID=A0A914X0Q3_9BILA
MTTNFVDKSKQKPLVEIQSIPCRVDHTGPAEVSQYFHRETLSNGHEKATFRGRPLDGHAVFAPDGYKLYLLKEKRIAVDGSNKTFEVHASTDKLTVWNLDKEPSERDPIRRAMNWVQIAQALADD